MKVYLPLINVTIWKINNRTSIGSGFDGTEIPVSSRMSNRLKMDITANLDENSFVTTTRSVRGEVGSFSIRIADRIFEGNDSLYGMVEPMDLVEIRMTHDYVESGQDIPIIMRGLVSSVSRSEAVDNQGRPQRYVVISGHDQLKLMHMLRVNYYFLTETGQWFLDEFATFHHYAPDGVVKNSSVSDFMGGLVKSMVDKYIADINSLNPSITAKKIAPWGFDVSVDGVVSAAAISSVHDDSLYNLVKMVLDIGPYNEMYIDDMEEATWLIVRKIPFRDVEGTPIQGDTESMDIHSQDIVSEDVHRSDENVCNYFWAQNNKWGLQFAMDQRAAAAYGSTQEFVRYSYVNCLDKLYGKKKLELDSQLGPPTETGGRSLITESDVLHITPFHKQREDFGGWLAERRHLLAAMNQDNVIFEQGTLRLRGNHFIKPGMYLVLYRGPTQVRRGMVYAHTVTHEYNTFVGYFTTIKFDRGTTFIERLQRTRTPYTEETEVQAVYDTDYQTFKDPWGQSH